MRKIAVMILGFFWVGVSATSVFAEVLILKDGKRVEGQITEKTDRLVRINVRGITLSYDTSDIERIEGEAASTADAAQILTAPSPNSNTLQDSPALISPAQKLLVLPSPRESALSNSPALSSDDQLSGMTKDQLIIALIEASGARDKLNDVLNQATAQASPEQMAKLRQLFNIDEMINQVAPIYDKYFTEDELRDLVRFYQSPLGRKLFMVTPLIIEESTRESLAYFQNKIQAMNPQPQAPQSPPEEIIP